MRISDWSSDVCSSDLNDAIWAAHGAFFAGALKLEGAQAIRATTGNPLLSPTKASDMGAPKGKDGDDAPVTLASLAAKGARFAVCGMATQGMAAQIAKTSGKPAKPTEDDLKANLLPGAVLVQAGVGSADSAPEHGAVSA